MNKFLFPVVLFLILVVFLAIGLTRNPHEIPSPLVGKTAPSFNLPLLDDPNKRLAPTDLKGQIWLLNVWASWCTSCAEEHPLLLELSRSGKVPLYGMNYKDQRGAALDWLARQGNPYVATISDSDGRIGIEYGVYGVPETYLIDRLGVIRYKQIGPMTPQGLKDRILPLITELQQ